MGGSWPSACRSRWVAAIVLRRVAPVLFAYTPSPSLLPLGRLRALARRRPRLGTSVVSALVGALTHVGWDLFTHDDRWAPRHIAWLRSHAVTLGGRWISWAEVLQYAGHVLGAALAIVLLSRILTSGAFERWYGVGADADVGPPPTGAAGFRAITALGGVAGAVSAGLGEPTFAGQVIRLSLGVGVGLAAASTAYARRVRLPVEVDEA